MGMRAVSLTVIGLIAFSMTSITLAQAPTSDKRPKMPASIANTYPDDVRNGPLFQRASLAFRAAKEKGGAGLAAFVMKGAKLDLSTYRYPSPVVHQPVDAKLIGALIDSCDGPLSHDEGKTWVQLNWVCRIDSDAPLANYYVFRDSPEIVMQIDFDGDKIKSILANEPLPVPGLSRLAMNAYEAVHGKR